MKSEWKRLKIGQIAKVKSGKRIPLGMSLVNYETPHPYIRGRDIRDGKISFEDPVFVPEQVFEKIKNYTVSQGDVCVTIVGNIGDIGQVPFSLDGANLTENAIKLVDLSEECNPNYLRYYLLSSAPQGQMKQYAAGAAQPKLGIYKVNDIDVSLPPMPTQQRIASILSGYDNLIENNLSRIKLLEQMVKFIYREWFVEFKAPHVKLRKALPEEKKVTGKDVFPAGWKVRKFTELVSVNPSVKVPKQGLKPFVPMSGLTNDSMLITEYELRDGNSGSKFQNNDTLFARITPCLENGKTAFVQFMEENDSVAFGSTEFIVFRSRILFPELVYLISRDDSFRNNAIKSMSGATGRQRVQEECFNKFLFPLPDGNSLKTCQNMLAPLFKQSYLLAIKNQNLRRTRDLLLPKLVSGELMVST